MAARNILKHHDLRHTACREEILALFLSESHALAHADIEKSLDKLFDRVTIYRTLKTFLEKQIIHKVLDDSGNLKYALQHSHEHEHPHVHFKCSICGLTNCLEDIEVPVLQLPDGYKVQNTNLLVQGVCQVCNKSTIDEN